MRDDDEILVVSDRVVFSGDDRARAIVTNTDGYWNCMNSVLPLCNNKTILWTADDIEPRDGWLELARKEFETRYPNGLGIVAMNDLGVRDATCGHAISTTKFLHVLFGNQGFFPHGFHHYFVDTLIADRAKALRRFYFCEEAVVEHMHYLFGKSERDALNASKEPFFGQDKAKKDAMDKEWENGEFNQAQMRLKS